eukprot:CAMPEP_0113486992 /NCGR_PEP_ID=MMETSP0014_2-20120614/25282_1 /TAXON_ID=2857 /ORGANISM="Nitzschia sp." /LENGTH=112 /DNA_ID=CAMNT_0000380681 /DNA_START=477 /DNA_END=815 /DNA_ORIENTATION=- /assembly_acc=CAM_ASM_000159
MARDGRFLTPLLPIFSTVVLATSGTASVVIGWFIPPVLVLVLDDDDDEHGGVVVPLLLAVLLVELDENDDDEDVEVDVRVRGAQRVLVLLRRNAPATNDDAARLIVISIVVA